MGVKPDSWIIKTSEKHALLDPFEPAQVRNNEIISYGPSSYGYDIRLSTEFKRPSYYGRGLILDPKSKNTNRIFEDYTGEICVIPPRSFVLGMSLEKIKLPRDVLGICFGKSTYARCGLVVNVTPIEPEWEGHLTISLSNTTGLPVKVYTNEGIAQLIFLEASSICSVSYKDKKGSYQGQERITTSIVNK